MSDDDLSRREYLQAVAGTGVVGAAPSVDGPVRPLIHDEIGDMFDGSPFPTKVFIVIQIIDECTGEPVEDAKIYPHWEVKGSTNKQSHIAPTSTVTKRGGFYVVTLTSETHHRGGKIQVPNAVTKGRAVACGQSIPLSDGVLEAEISLTEMINTLVGKPSSIEGALKTVLEASIGASAPVKLSTQFPTYWAVITASVRCDCAEPDVVDDDGDRTGGNGSEEDEDSGNTGGDSGGNDTDSDSGDNASGGSGGDSSGDSDGGDGDSGGDDSGSGDASDESGSDGGTDDSGSNGGTSDRDGESKKSDQCEKQCSAIRRKLEAAKEQLRQNRKQQKQIQSKIDEKQNQIDEIQRENKVWIYQNTASGEVITGANKIDPKPPLEYKGWMMNDDAAERIDQLEQELEQLNQQIKQLKNKAARLRDRIEHLANQLRHCLKDCRGSDPGTIWTPQPPVAWEVAPLPSLGQATTIDKQRRWDELGFEATGPPGLEDRSEVKNWAEEQSGYFFADSGDQTYEPPDISIEDVMTDLFDGGRGDPVDLPRQIPQPFSTERVDIYISQPNGPTEVLGFDLDGDQLTMEVGGVDDPTKFVSTDRTTFFEIMYSENPVKTAERARKQGDLTIGGVGTWNTMEWTASRTVVDVGGFVGGIGRAMSRIGGYF